MISSKKTRSEYLSIPEINNFTLVLILGFTLSWKSLDNAFAMISTVWSKETFFKEEIGDIQFGWSESTPNLSLM